MRRWHKWLEHPRMALICSLACMAAIGALMSYWEHQAKRSTQPTQIQRYAAARTDAPVIYSMGCDDWYHSAEVRICEFGNADASHTAVLIGDSHVGQWFPAVRAALDISDWRLLVMTKSSCPMVDAPIFYSRIGREYTECAQWRHDALLKVTQIAPDILLFGSAYAAFTQEQWTEGTASVLGRISTAVDRVFLLLDTPSLPFDGPDCLVKHAIRPDWLAGSDACSSPAASPQAEAIKIWLGAAVARFPNVALLDMNTYVCPGGICHAELDGQIVFRDSQHLSGSFSEALSAPMKKRLFGQESDGEPAH